MGVKLGDKKERPPPPPPHHHHGTESYQNKNRKTNDYLLSKFVHHCFITTFDHFNCAINSGGWHHTVL